MYNNVTDKRFNYDVHTLFYGKQSSFRSAFPIVGLFVFIVIMIHCFAGQSLAVYEPGFQWDLKTDFDYPAGGSARSTDSEANYVWDYFGGYYIGSDTDWQNRQPQNAVLLDTDFSDSDWSVYRCSWLDILSYSWFLRVKKLHSPGGAVSMYCREYRMMGTRWVSPVAGQVNVSGAVGTPSYSNVRWAVDSYINGVSVKNLATGTNAGNFNLSAIGVNAGDVISISFAPIPWDEIYGEHSVDMTIDLVVSNEPDEYAPGFQWDLKTDFDCPAEGPAQSKDQKGEYVWYYFGGDYVGSDTDWQSRQPQSAGLLDRSLSGPSDRSGYSLASLGILTYSIKKQHSTSGTVSMDGKEYRMIGTRWVAPVAANVDISGTISTPSYGGIRWAVDSNIDGVLTRNLATGTNAGNFNVPAIGVDVGDVISLSFAPNSLNEEYGEHIVDMSIVLNCGIGQDADLNKDCNVDLADLGVFAQDWLRCNDPENVDCEDTW